MWPIGVESLGQVHGPHLLAGALLQADQRAVGGLGIEPVAIERGSAARAVASLLVVGFAGRSSPHAFARLDIDGEDELLAAPLALREQKTLRNGERGVAFSQSFRFPDQRRTIDGPGF